tara:strand:+ start:460 stop:1812 length:1353 start_codon:yes stop_codon:yes gene_type:complete
MKALSLEDIALKGGGKLIGTASMLNINGISIDSRSIEKGNIFIALKGPSFDGHNYLREAEKKGASSFVVEKVFDSRKTYILVEDTYKFLDDLAIKRRNDFRGKLVSVTGSNGKTTTKEIIYSLLSSEGRCHKTLDNKNNNIGVPLTLSTLEKDLDFSVIEIGTNSPGEINDLSEIVKPDVAVITNVTPSHLEGFGSIDKIAEEKGFILDHIQEGGVAVLPRDSRFFEKWKKRTRKNKIISFGLDKKSDIVLNNTEIDVLNNLMSFNIEYSDTKLRCQMHGIAAHNAMNACAALAVGMALNLDLTKICLNLSKVDFPNRRLSIHKALKNSLVIDDSYNANPESMKRSLDVIKNLTDKKRIFIAGQMEELGLKEALFHEQVCAYAKGKVEEFLCVGELWEGGLKHLPKIGKCFKSKDDLFDYISENITEDLVFLVKGSRASGMEFIADKLKA